MNRRVDTIAKNDSHMFGRTSSIYFDFQANIQDTCEKDDV